MMDFLVFAVKMIISSGLLYGYYHLFLRNQRFHGYNRFYLLLATLVSLIIPLMHIPVSLLPGHHAQQRLLRTLQVITVSWGEPVTIYAHPATSWSWLNTSYVAIAIYLVVSAIAIAGLLKSLLYIHRLTLRYPYQQLNDVRIYQTQEPGTPFSFFRRVFWDSTIQLNDFRGQQILRHELYHVKEVHSADLLLFEILTSVFWFNPFFHLIKKEAKAIHEFLADADVAGTHNGYDYAELLLLQAIGKTAPAITHSFFHNQLKRRITMLTQSNFARRGGYISRIMALPILFLLVSAFAVKITQSNASLASRFRGNKPITVIIDPGHGGKYAGASVDNWQEKDVTLAIAQKIQALAAKYNLRILLTRNSDEMAGQASTLASDLENRIRMSADAHADVFVSIHVNATPEKTTDFTGFDAYVSNKKNDTKSRVLASALLTSLKDVYAVDEVIKERQVGVQVLDKTVCPSVLIECGYSTNAKDLAFINNAANQELVAQKILEGLVAYSEAATTPVAQKNNDDAAATAPTNAEAPALSPAETITDPVIGNGIRQEPVFTKVEQEAEYPGGQASWTNYLIKTVKYPKHAIAKNIQGTVVMQFIVDTTGKVLDLQAISGPKELQEEATRVIAKSGKWISAVQNGRKVKAYKRQPITFKLQA